MGGMIPTLAKDPAHSYRFWVHMFLHGSLLHIIMNSIALHFAGRFLEMMVGRFWTLATFLVSGYGAAHVAMHFSDPQTVLIGASGGVMGVLGAMLFCAFLLPKSPIRKELIRSSYQIIIPSLIPLFSGVSYSAHLGGVLVGLVCGFLITFFLRIRRRF